MNVALLPNIAGYGVPSMERYASHLAAALAAVAMPEWRFESMQIEPDLRFGPLWGGRIGRLVTYPRQVSRCRADIFHILDHSHAHLARAAPAGRAVMTFHDCIPILGALGRIDMPVGWRARLGFAQRLRDADRCARVITDSEMTKLHLVEFGRIDSAKIVVIPLGVSGNFQPTPPGGQSRADERAEVLREYALPPDCLLLAHVGTGGAYKNVPGLLRIVHALAADAAIGSRIRLIRVGAPCSGDERRLSEALGLGDRIRFAERLPTDAALARVYRAADLLLFPSLWEGFGWPPLEAMACGTPPVTSNAGALPEVVGDVSAMAPAADIERLAGIARQLLTDPELHQAAVRRGLARAASFSWEACASKVCAVYAAVAG